MTAPARALVAIPHTPHPARRPRRRALPAVAQVTLYDPRKLAALRTAIALGGDLVVTFDGYTLTISARPRTDITPAPPKQQRGR